MNTLIRSAEFDQWLRLLKDMTARVRILARLRLATLGNLGDCAPVGEGVSEMRIHVGAGYRVYFFKEGDCVYVILAGGDKSTQKKDIARARHLMHERKNES